MANAQSPASEKALAILTAALQSSSLRLLPLNSTGHGEIVGAANALCIAKFLTDLTATIKEME